MQQTTNYQLNLIETSDAFSPNPLNDNTQKLEAALDAARAEAKAGDAAEADARSKADAAEADARSKADAAEANARTSAINALANRVTTLEARHIACGVYADAVTVNLGFQPKVVLVNSLSANITSGAIALDSGVGNAVAKITSNGFTIASTSTTTNNLNSAGPYAYIAVG